jgi:hypothetical protein
VEELTRELHESIINLLYWSGVPTDPDHTMFVPDDHFEARSASAKQRRAPAHGGLYYSNRNTRVRLVAENFTSGEIGGSVCDFDWVHMDYRTTVGQLENRSEVSRLI